MAEETAARLKKIGNEGVDVVLTAEDMGRDVRVSPVGKQLESGEGRPNHIHAAMGVALLGSLVVAGWVYGQ